MISLIVFIALIAVVAAILLKHALQAILLVGVVGVLFVAACYVFDADPQVVLGQGIRTTQHELRTHKHDLDRL
jgi:uncharacterized MnhB-related membrane protein